MKKSVKIYVIADSLDRLEHSIHSARQEAEKYYRSLIIFDDIIGHKVTHSRTSPYVNLLIGGRHDGISTITLTQQLNSLSKPARDQFTRVISFYNPDADDRKILFHKYLVDIGKEERQQIIQHLRHHDYSYIDINILKGTFLLR